MNIDAAADDAAGIGIASRMEAQIRGLNQAIRNASDGQSLIDTAEGAHAEVEFILQRMRELAVQSANDTNVAGDRSNLQAEITQLVAEIDRISSQTTWNGERVLDGTFTSKQLQIGADAGQVTSFDIDSIHTTQLGAHKITLETKADATSAIVGDTLALTGYLGSSDVIFAAAASAKDIAATINAVTANTGVEATAKTKVLLSSLSGSDSIQFDINGVTIANTATIQTDLRALRDSINAVSAASGVTASVGATNASLVLTAIDGRDITIENFVSGGGDKTLDVDALDADGGINANATQQTLDDTPTDATVTGFVELTSNKTFSFSATTGTDYANDSADLVFHA